MGGDERQWEENSNLVTQSGVGVRGGGKMTQVG